MEPCEGFGALMEPCGSLGPSWNHVEFWFPHGALWDPHGAVWGIFTACVVPWKGFGVLHAVKESVSFRH